MSRTPLHRGFSMLVRALPTLRRLLFSYSPSPLQLTQARQACCRASIHVIRNRLRCIGSQRLFSTESTVNDTKSETTDTTAEAQVDDQVTQLNEQLEKLKADNEALSSSSRDFEDKYRRALAEAQNIRQRMQKQVDDAKMFGIQGFCKDLLGVCDVLRLASENISKDQLGDATIKAMYDGLVLTEAQLLKVLEGHGVTVISPEGEKFDPNFHEALFQQPVQDKEPGTVFAVTKLGYKLHQRVLRPAMVGVVKAP